MPKGIKGDTEKGNTKRGTPKGSQPKKDTPKGKQPKRETSNGVAKGRQKGNKRETNQTPPGGTRGMDGEVGVHEVSCVTKSAVLCYIA